MAELSYASELLPDEAVWLLLEDREARPAGRRAHIEEAQRGSVGGWKGSGLPGSRA